MLRLFAALTLLAATLWSAPSFAQGRAQLGPLCTSEGTPADQQIDVCNKIIALKVFKGGQLATVYFWRAVGWNKKGDYDKVISDTTEGIRLAPDQALYNLRGSAYFDKGENDIAIADFNDALKLGPPSGLILHNRANAYKAKHDYAKALADYTEAIRLYPGEAYIYDNRGSTKLKLGDIDGALADVNEAIRLNPKLPAPLITRTVIWRAKGNFDRAIDDGSEAIRLAKSNVPLAVLTAPNSVLIAGYIHRALAYEAKGDVERAKDDYRSTLQGTAADAGSKANQATARVRLSLLTDAAPTPRNTPSDPAQPQADSAPQGQPASPPAAPDTASRGKRMALVIGNGAYTHVKALANPSNDARAVAKSLRDIGFAVTEGIDLDRARMQKMTRDFLRDAAQAQLAVVYYAGHGVQIDGRNYLIPVDVELKSGTSMTASMIDMETIMAGLDDHVRTNILIFDACRNNPMAPQAATTGTNRAIDGASGLAAPTSLGSGATLGAGTLIAFATAPGQVALDGEGANSPFSAALSRRIGTPGLEVQQMLTRVRAEVVSGTKNRQVPWSNSSLLGEVYLAEK